MFTNNLLRGKYYAAAGAAGGAGEGQTEEERLAAEAAEKAAREGESVTLTKAELQDKLNAEAAKSRQMAERKAQKVIDDLKAEQARKEAEAGGQFKELYEATLKQLTELQAATAGQTEALNKCTERAHSLVDSEIANWPDECKATDPGKDSDIEVRIKWKELQAPVAKKLMDLGTAPAGEHGAGGSSGSSEEDKKDKNKPAEVVKQRMDSQFPIPDRLKPPQQ